MTDVTQILRQIEGDPRAAERLLPLVYDELRKLAASRLAQEKPGQTLQAMALKQTKPVERRVALKIIKPGMDTKQVIGVPSKPSSTRWTSTLAATSIR